MISLNLAILSLLGTLTALLVSIGYRVFHDDADPGATHELFPATLRVEVQNGCGVRGAAMAAASLLRTGHGIDVVTIGNARGVRLEQTVVLDRVGRPELARRVAAAIGATEAVLQRRPGSDYDMTVVLGYEGGRWDAGVLGEEGDRGS